VTLFAKQVQYAVSTHRNGGNFERSTTSCATCHTHQGFLERMATGNPATEEDVLDPAPINCRTCHQIHTTYTDADYALTATDPVELQFAGGTIDYGAQAGNLCAQCHQARPVSPVPVPGGDPVNITSSRYGVHHGPQGTIIAGVGAVEFEGSMVITGGPSSHGDVAANAGMCATCHMGEAFGQQSGGHTWKMKYIYHDEEEENVAGCQSCHGPNFTSFASGGNIPGTVQTLLKELEQRLFDIGVKRAISDDYTIHGLNVYANTGIWPADVAGAFLNWQMFAEDRSLGLHNPAYATAVIQNSIEAVEGYPDAN
jgi:hypothetical protein